MTDAANQFAALQIGGAVGGAVSVPQAGPPEDEYERLKRSARSRRGKLTMKLAAYTAAISAAGITPSKYTVEEVEKAGEKVDDASERVEEVYLRLITICSPDDAPTFEKKLEDATNEILASKERAAAVIAAWQQRHTRAAAPAPAPQPVWRGTDDTIKPGVLSLDWSPREYRRWCGQLFDFFEANNYRTLPPARQYPYVRQFIDLDIETRIEEERDPEVAVFTDDGAPVADGAIDLISREFMVQYPLGARRREFFQYSRQQGQSPSAFVATLVQLGQEADLAQLTPDQILVHRVMTGINDDGTLSKLLELNEPTFAEVKKKLTMIEVSKGAKKAICGASSNKSRQVQNKNKGQSNKGKDKGALTPESLKGKCTRCGSESHRKEKCKHVDTQCNKCGKTGHLHRVCLEEFNSQKSRQVNEDRAEDSDEGQVVNLVRAVTTKEPPKEGTRGKPTPLAEFTVRRVEDGKPRGPRFIIKGVPDSGTTRTIIARDLVLRMGINIRDNRETMRTATGGPMDCSGEVTFEATAGGAHAIINAAVSRDLHGEMLVSWHDLILVEILPPNFPNTLPRSAEQSIRKVKTSDDSKDSLMEEFKDTISDSIAGRKVKGPPASIKLKPGAKPVRILRTKQVALHKQEEAKKTLEKLISNGIIVKTNEPTEWISPAHFVPKSDGSLRLVTDFSALNKWIERPVTPFPSASEIIEAIPAGSRYFASLDAIMGYFQVELDEKSSSLTTFLLPDGRYKYTRLPMGAANSGDEWNVRSDPVVEGLPWARKIIDDILVSAPTEETLGGRVREILTRCRERGITISRKKFQWGQEVRFAGFVVSAEGVAPEPEKVQALQDFPTPTDISELRSFLGLANQLGAFTPDMVLMSTEMRKLLKKGTAFLWLEEHEDEFKRMKTLLASFPMVRPFDPRLPTELLTDACRKGLGFMLLQREENGAPRVIKCGSMSLTPAQTRYAIIELEALAISKAIQKCRFYLQGCPQFSVITDHRPLLGVVRRDITEIDNKRLAKFKLETMPYNIVMKWEAGKLNSIADALSRAPIFPAEESEHSDWVTSDGEENENRTEEGERCARVKEDPALSLLFDSIDEEYMSQVRAVREKPALKTGKFPAFPPSHPANQLKSVWAELSLLDDEEETLMLIGDRIVVPRAARERVLQLLHVPHQGITRTRAAAREAFFWPGMNNEVKQLIEACSKCQEDRASQQMEPIQYTPVHAPMDRWSVDLADIEGKPFLVAVDEFSGYPFAMELTRTTTQDVWERLLVYFTLFGYPREIRSDNGPQFRRQFAELCADHGIRHTTSSPYFPSSNGMAEAAVKSVKAMLKKVKRSEREKAMQQLRGTPRAEGPSAAEMFFGRAFRDALPKLTPKTDFDPEGRLSRRLANEAKVETTPTKELSQLRAGTKVRVQNPHTKKWDNHGEVVKRDSNGRSYDIRLSDGSETRRNRRFLKPIHEDSEEESEDAEDSKDANEAHENTEAPRSPVITRSRVRLVTSLSPDQLRPPVPVRSSADIDHGSLIKQAAGGGQLDNDHQPHHSVRHVDWVSRARDTRPDGNQGSGPDRLPRHPRAGGVEALAARVPRGKVVHVALPQHGSGERHQGHAPRAGAPGAPRGEQREEARGAQAPARGEVEDGARGEQHVLRRQQGAAQHPRGTLLN